MSPRYLINEFPLKLIVFAWQILNVSFPKRHRNSGTTSAFLRTRNTCRAPNKLRCCCPPFRKFPYNILFMSSRKDKVLSVNFKFRVVTRWSSLLEDMSRSWRGSRKAPKRFVIDESYGKLLEDEALKFSRVRRTNIMGNWSKFIEDRDCGQEFHWILKYFRCLKYSRFLRYLKYSEHLKLLRSSNNVHFDELNIQSERNKLLDW